MKCWFSESFACWGLKDTPRNSFQILKLKHLLPKTKGGKTSPPSLISEICDKFAGTN